tara:strand:- start:217 stop:459 length:243 start_codon:yes stop_codon:yes gene_type:complete
MVNIIQTYFSIYFTEIIVGVLIISIAIVLVSIFYVLFSSTDDAVIKKIVAKKIKKIKYTKQFLKGVDGIDLDLKVVNKKS